MIMIKEDFKLKKKTFSYWIDALTTIWDNNISDKLDPFEVKENKFFRIKNKTQNYLFLVQMIEASLFNISFYSYPQPIIVLSAMYLLVRINMENEKDGFKYYIESLKRSSNTLFVDRTGVNIIYG